MRPVLRRSPAWPWRQLACVRCWLTATGNQSLTASCRMQQQTGMNVVCATLAVPLRMHHKPNNGSIRTDRCPTVSRFVPARTWPVRRKEIVSHNVTTGTVHRSFQIMYNAAVPSTHLLFQDIPAGCAGSCN